MAAPRQDAGSSGRQAAKPLIAPSPTALLGEPLDFLLVEHFRQREVASLLSRIADGENGAMGVLAMQSVYDFLKNDLIAHVLDEELVLFPALRRLCRPEDNIERLIGILAKEHADDRRLGRDVADAISRRIDGALSTLADTSRMRQLTEHLRGHIALENGVLLPIARARLTSDAVIAVAQGLRRLRAI